MDSTRGRSTASAATKGKLLHPLAEPSSPKTPTTVCSNTIHSTPDCTPRSTMASVDYNGKLDPISPSSISSLVDAYDATASTPASSVAGLSNVDLATNLSPFASTASSALLGSVAVGELGVRGRASHTIPNGGKIDVAIVGGGPAGLAAALTINRLTGRTAHVFEKKGELLDSDEFFAAMQTNGLDALQFLSEDLERQVLEKGYVVTKGIVWTDADETPTVHQLKQEGIRGVVLRWAEVRALLLDCCLMHPEGIHVHLNSGVAAIRNLAKEAGGIAAAKEITFSDGHRIEANLVIAADDFKPSFRKLSDNFHCNEVEAGRVQIGGMLSAKRYQLPHDEFWMWEGGEACVCTVTPVSHNYTAWTVCLDQPIQMWSKEKSKKLSMLNAMDETIGRYSKAPEMLVRLKELIRATEEADIRLSSGKANGNIDSQEEGILVLGGSQAAMLGFGSDLNAAFEDAVQLAICLAEYSSNDLHALQRFAEIRMQRVGPAAEPRGAASQFVLTRCDENADYVRLPNFVPMRSRVSTAVVSPNLMEYSLLETEYM